MTTWTSWLTWGWLGEDVMPPICGRETLQTIDLNSARHKSLMILTEIELERLRTNLRPSGRLPALLEQIPPAPECPPNPFCRGWKHPEGSFLRELRQTVREA